ncbi:MAG: hypothetical protein ACOYIP_06205 [Coriobacteriales bacterium]
MAQAKTRRLQDTLSAAGSGVIAFCVWSLAKTVLFLRFADPSIVHQLLGIEDDAMAFAVYLSTAIVVIVDLCLRAYVGRSARAEGRGRKRGTLYLVIAVIVAVANASSLVGIAFGTSFALSPLVMVVSIAIEATALAALVLVIVSALRLRRMDKAEG